MTPAKRRQAHLDAEIGAYFDVHGGKATAAHYGLNLNQVNGIHYRYSVARQNAATAKLEASAPPPIDPPLELQGDWMIVNDVHVPTTDYKFAERVSRIAKRHLPDCQGLIINGDLMNFDAFSPYSPLVGHPTWAAEVEAGKILLTEWLSCFKRVVYILGNHEHRIFKATNGQITIQHLLNMVMPTEGLEISIRDRLTVHTDNGDWTVVHGANYSRNQLWNPDRLAQKFNTHVIAGHEHHWGIGMDTYKRFTVVANGGLFDVDKLAYVQLRTTTSPGMAKGFSMLRGGYCTLFGEDHVTDWNYWLPKPLFRRGGRR